MIYSSIFIDVFFTALRENNLIFSYEGSAIKFFKRIPPVKPVAPIIIAVLLIALIIPKQNYCNLFDPKSINQYDLKFILLFNFILSFKVHRY